MTNASVNIRVAQNRLARNVLIMSYGLFLGCWVSSSSFLGIGLGLEAFRPPALLKSLKPNHRFDVSIVIFAIV